MDHSKTITIFMKMQRIERSSSSYEDFHSFNRASPLIKYPRSNLLSSNARWGETFLRFNYKTHPVFHREIIIFVSIRGEKRAIRDINSGEENASRRASVRVSNWDKGSVIRISKGVGQSSNYIKTNSPPMLF